MKIGRFLFLAIALASVPLAAVPSAAAGAGSPSVESLVAKFADTPRATDQAKAINAWIFSSISAEGKPRANHKVSETLNLMDGSCGNRVHLAREIADGINVPTRGVSFFGVPYQIGHAALEFYTEGEWRFFDPSFGIYFARPGAMNEPVSLKTARSLYPDVVIMRADVEPWTGTPLGRSAHYAPSEFGLIKHYQNPGLVIADMVATYFTADMSIEGTGSEYEGRVFIDLDHFAAGNLGEADGSLADTISPYHQLSGIKQYNPLMFVIGHYKGDIGPKVAQRFQFSSRTTRVIELKIEFLADVEDADRKLLVVGAQTSRPMSKMVEIKRSWSERAVTIEFTASPGLSELVVKMGGNSGVKSWHVDVFHWKTLVEDRTTANN